MLGRDARRQITAGDVADEIAELVDVNDFTDNAAIVAQQAGLREDGIRTDHRADSGERCSLRQLRGDRRHDLAAMKRGAHGLRRENFIADGMNGFFIKLRKHVTEDTVVGGDESVAAGGSGEEAALGTDAGIDDDQKDGRGRKVAIRLFEQKGCRADIKGVDVMGDVDDVGRGCNSLDGALEHTDEAVVEAVVGQERNRAHGGGLTPRCFPGSAGASRRSASRGSAPSRR